jgi:DNA-binding response OmpR family regulator
MRRRKSGVEGNGGTVAIARPGVSGARPRVLVIDDETGFLSVVARGLTDEGFDIETAGNGATGLSAALRERFDLVILDVLMPGMDGATVLQRLRQHHPVQPVLILSCMTDTSTKVALLEMGADDYLGKPFSLDELVARVRVRLRHGRNGYPHVLRADGATLDLARRLVDVGNGPQPLTEREFLLLQELMSHLGETLSKEHLLATVWGYQFDPGSNVVDVYIRRLRAKVGPELIRTVRGEGYRVDA